MTAKKKLVCMSMRLCVPNRKSDVGTILSSTQGFKAWMD